MGEHPPRVNGARMRPDGASYIEEQFDEPAGCGQMPGMTEDPRRERRRRLGRRLGIVVFGVIVASITALWSIQIIIQVWAPEPGPAATNCRDGIRELLGALRRARAAAAQEANGERAALARFRQALEPEWHGRVRLDPMCQTDPLAARALSQLTALRYAEEHAVRYEAVALAEQRRRVDAITRDLLGPDAVF